jgi:hypothetical protein
MIALLLLISAHFVSSDQEPEQPGCTKEVLSQFRGVRIVPIKDSTEFTIKVDRIALKDYLLRIYNNTVVEVHGVINVDEWSTFEPACYLCLDPNRQCVPEENPPSEDWVNATICEPRDRQQTKPQEWTLEDLIFSPTATKVDHFFVALILIFFTLCCCCCEQPPAVMIGTDQEVLIGKARVAGQAEAPQSRPNKEKNKAKGKKK